MADLPTILMSQAFIASGKYDQFLYTAAADEIWKLRREAREAAKRIQQLTDAAREVVGYYELNSQHPSEAVEALAALLKENDK